jgi:GNAT superfamily N-acetyltransferase
MSTPTERTGSDDVASRVVPLQRDQARAAADALARAFAADATWGLVLPDEAERRRVLPLVWRALVHYSLANGVVLTTPAIDGVACLLPADRSRVTAWRDLRTGLGFCRVILSLSAASRRRFLGVWPRIDVLRREAIPRRHGYLWALGVEPRAQQRGVGGTLVEAVCAGCDEAAVPCVLETESKRNVGFCERRGFRAVRAETIEPAGVRVFLLVREPLRAPERVGLAYQHDA